MYYGFYEEYYLIRVFDYSNRIVLRINSNGMRILKWQTWVQKKQQKNGEYLNKRYKDGVESKMIR